MAGRPARPARPADRTHATPGGAGAHLGRTGLPADRGPAAMNRKQTFVLAGVALLVLLVRVGLGWWWAGATYGPSPPTHPAATAPGPRAALAWSAPLVRTQHSHRPGKSPFLHLPRA